MDETNPLDGNPAEKLEEELSGAPAPGAQAFEAPAPPPAATAATQAPPPPAAAQVSNQPAGWYPAPGGQRYWDGAQWTEHTAPAAGAAVPSPMSQTDERQMAMLAHLGQLVGLISGVGGFLVPLILLLTKGKESDFVRRAAAESLNFWITGFIAVIISFVLILVVIGIVLLPIVGLIWVALPIYAGVKANEGVDYRYPFNIRPIS